jgi:hypothetical protein
MVLVRGRGEGLGKPWRGQQLSPPEIVRLQIEGKEIVFEWGRSFELGTAAFWVAQTKMRRPPAERRLGSSLEEEVVACILGGFGLPASVGLAAFEEVRNSGLISSACPPAVPAVQSVLERPLTIHGRNAPVRYRFPRQRAERVSAALQFLGRKSAPNAPIELRAWLLGVPGIGPKTASWITRNWTGANVAIIDIHVRRAGISAGFFRPEWRLPQDYPAFEAAFRAVARLGHVSCADLDARIWGDLSFLGRDAPLLIGETPPESPIG